MQTIQVLIRKSDKSVVRHWRTPPARIDHPDKPGGALCMGTPSTPLDLGGYIYDEATVEGFEPFDPATQKRSGPVFTVDDLLTVTATYTVTDKTAEELAAEKVQDDKGVISQMATAKAMWLLVELIDNLLAQGTISASDFSAEVKQAYLDLKAKVDSVKG